MSTQNPRRALGSNGDKAESSPSIHGLPFSPNSLLLGFYLRKKKSWPHSRAAPLNSVAGLCGWALCPGLVLLLSCVTGCKPCPLSSSWPRPELCGWALWAGLCEWALVCPGLVLLLSSVAGLLLWPCVQALSSSCRTLAGLRHLSCRCPLAALTKPVLALLLSLSSSCPAVVLPLSSSCPAVVFLLSFSCPPILHSERCRADSNVRSAH